MHIPASAPTLLYGALLALISSTALSASAAASPDDYVVDKAASLLERNRQQPESRFEPILADGHSSEYWKYHQQSQQQLAQAQHHVDAASYGVDDISAGEAGGATTTLDKRRKKTFEERSCPGSLSACSLPSGSFECLDTTQELASCGGCIEAGGRDCEAIPHVVSVSCAASQCEVHACEKGYRPSSDRSYCVATTLKIRRIRM